MWFKRKKTPPAAVVVNGGDAEEAARVADDARRAREDQAWAVGQFAKVCARLASIPSPVDRVVFLNGASFRTAAIAAKVGPGAIRQLRGQYIAEAFGQPVEGGTR